jgi:phosphatidylglycerol---prolipoprotein diacylglyceryl transferase
MRRVLFRAHGVTVWSYPALLYAGLVCGFYVMYAIAPSVGMPSGPAAVAALILFAPAIAGSRLWFVVDHWTFYRRQPRRIWRHSEGGLTLYGGLVLALLLSPAILKALGLRFADFWDAATFTILVGMIFTRGGCLLNGCCSGRRSDGPLGLRLPDHTGHWERRYPVALLEMGCSAVLLGTSVALLEAGVPRGTIFGVGLAGYAGVRLVLDRLRVPSPSSHASHRLALSAFITCSVLAATVGWLMSGL